jgi:cbb3-type cytochrome oxidase subunit 1
MIRPAALGPGNKSIGMTKNHKMKLDLLSSCTYISYHRLRSVLTLCNIYMFEINASFGIQYYESTL